MPFLLMTWLFEDNIFIIKILSIPTKPSFKYNLDIILLQMFVVSCFNNILGYFLKILPYHRGFIKNSVIDNNIMQ